MGSQSISSSISNSGSAEIKEFIKTRIIVSCCLGISSLSTESISGKIGNYLGGKYYTHTALWLSDKKMEEDESALGLILEYGCYDQEYDVKVIVDDKGQEKEMKIKKDSVIYHYGDEGGLRYYVKEYDKFQEIFGTIAFVDLDIDTEQQLKFDDFMKKCAPDKENEWIKDKYNWRTHNCHDFSERAIRILKPIYIQKNIIIKDKSKKTSKERESVLPNGILKALKNN